MKKAKDIKKVAVLGCGLIGYSWATVFSRNDLSVNICAVHKSSLDTVKDRVEKALRFLYGEGVIDERTAAKSIENIYLCTTVQEAVQGVDYVQECFAEDLEVKQDAYKTVTDITSANVIVGSSCSGLRLRDITAKVEKYPERCIVAHPTNPPHLIPFMEISGDKASKEVKKTAFDFMEMIGQKPVFCKEVYGYVLNRIQLALIQEALYLVEQDICSVEAVERAVTNGLGLRWAFTGPYGVEELNSSNLEEGLRKYKNYMIEGFANLGKIKAYNEEFIYKAVKGFIPVMNNLSHDQYKKWRDKMVIRTRLLKEISKKEEI